MACLVNDNKGCLPDLGFEYYLNITCCGRKGTTLGEWRVVKGHKTIQAPTLRTTLIMSKQSACQRGICLYREGVFDAVEDFT
jgi:hypothetical protein